MTTFTRGFISTGTSSYLIGVKDNVNYILSYRIQNGVTELLFSPYVPILTTIFPLKMFPQWNLTTNLQQPIVVNGGILEIGTTSDTPIVVSATTPFLLSGTYTGVIYTNENVESITTVTGSGNFIGTAGQSPGIIYSTIPPTIVTTEVP
jgi:hypothetical protein